MVKKSSNMKTAPLASFESLISIESCKENNENNSNWGRWSEQENHFLETDIHLTSFPWTSPSWQRMSLSRQNCQIYQVFKFLYVKKYSKNSFVSNKA